MKRPRLLIVTYYFPPLGGIGPQRMLRFARYLGQHGWDVTIARPNHPSYEVRDETELGEEEPFKVVDVPIWELPRLPVRPYKLRGLVSLLYEYVIPDVRAGWILAGRRAVACLARENDVVLSSSPPFSAHVLASISARSAGKPWVADFRDPFVGNWYDRPRQPRLRAWLQKLVLSGAAAVVVAWSGISDTLVGSGPPATEILSGIQPVNGQEIERRTHDQEFLIVHSGSLYSRRRDAVRWLLDGLKRARAENPCRAARIRLKFVGNTGDLRSMVQGDAELRDVVEVLPFVPRVEAQAIVAASDAVLLISPSFEGAGDFVPGKLFDYLASGKPVLALLGRGRAMQILAETGGAVSAAYDDPKEIASALLTLADEVQEAEPESLTPYLIESTSAALSTVLARVAGVDDPMRRST